MLLSVCTNVDRIPVTANSDYDTNGFIVMRSFLHGAALARLQSEIVRYIRNIVPHLSEADAFYEDRARPETLKQLNRMQQDPFFAELLTDARWLSAAEELLGESARAQGAEWFNKPAGTAHATPPHQDNFYFCFDPPQVLTMWLALDDVDAENGCLRYIPGSHRRGMRPHSRTRTLGFSQGIADYGDADRAAEVAINARPGDLLVHHGNTIHRADANCSATRQRRSFAIVFQGASCRRDEAVFQRYLASAAVQHRELGVETT